MTLGAKEQGGNWKFTDTPNFEIYMIWMKI